MSTIIIVSCNLFIQIGLGPVLDLTRPIEPGRSSHQHQGGPTNRSCPQDQTSRTIRNPVGVFKYRKLHTADISDGKIIPDKNMAAHGADAIANATLYMSNTVLKPGLHTDAFEKLYNLHLE